MLPSNQALSLSHIPISLTSSYYIYACAYMFTVRLPYFIHRVSSMKAGSCLILFTTVDLLYFARHEVSKNKAWVVASSSCGSSTLLNTRFPDGSRLLVHALRATLLPVDGRDFIALAENPRLALYKLPSPGFSLWFIFSLLSSRPSGLKFQLLSSWQYLLLQASCWLSTTEMSVHFR